MDALRLKASTPRGKGAWIWEALLVLVVLATLSYTWMFERISVPNERSRVYLAVAMVDEGTVEIDGPLRRFGKIYDLARRDGHYYSDKAPGSSILGAAVYWIARKLDDSQGFTIYALINLMRTWLMLPFGIVGFLMLRRILRFLGVDPPIVDVVSLGWLLGSSAFHYSTAYFGHQIVAVFLLIAFDAALRAQWAARFAKGRKRTLGWSLLAGAACGFAGLTEYQAIVPAALLAAWMLFEVGRKRPASFVMLVLGAAPFALALLAYNTVAFGGPFELSYHHLASAQLREIHGQGIAGVTVPTWEYFSGAMFSLHRGLIGTSPMYALAPVGLLVLIFGRDRGPAFVLGGTMLYFVAFISSSNMWFAGWGFGPRLLVPAMGYLAILVAVASQRLFTIWPLQGLVRGAALGGIAYHQIVHAFFPEAPDSATNPLVDFIVGMWRADLVSPNLAIKYTELSGVESLWPLAALVCFSMLVVLLRGLLTLGRLRRAVVVVLSVALLGGYLYLVFDGEGAWDQAKRSKWMKMVEGWGRTESSFRADVERGIEMIREKM